MTHGADMRRQRKSPLSTAKDWVQENKDPPGFAIIQCPIKGRGIITTVTRTKGDFLLHYDGEVVSADEGERREAQWSSGFRFFYNVGQKDFCVDATKETGRLGRLVNHGDKTERNAVMKQIDGHLLLFSLRDIEIGEEITYDYGIAELPWKKLQNNDLNVVDDLSDDRVALDPDNQLQTDISVDGVALDPDNQGEPDINGDGVAINQDSQGEPGISDDSDNKGEPDISGSGVALYPYNEEEPGIYDDSDNQGEPGIYDDSDNQGEPDIGGNGVALDPDNEGEPGISDDSDNQWEPDISGSGVALDPDYQREPDISVDPDHQGEPDVSSDGVAIDLDISGNGVALDPDNQGEPGISVDPDHQGEPDTSGDGVAIDLDISGNGVAIDPDNQGEPGISDDSDHQGERNISGIGVAIDLDTSGNVATSDPDNQGEPDIWGDPDSQGESDINSDGVALDLDNQGEPDISDDGVAVEPDDQRKLDPYDNGAAVGQVGKCTTVAFSGSFPNQGFFKLFDGFKLANQIKDTDILIVPASEYGNTSCTTLKLFQSLLGRRVKIVSKKWVRDSLMQGSVQDLSKYLVTSASRYGEWSDDEDYQPFEFQIVGKEWLDIAEFDVRNLLENMGGIEVLTASSRTILVCADGEIHTSDMCVGKEWIFQSIVEGRIKLPSLQNDCDIVDLSDDESITVEYQAFTPGKKIYIQTSGSVSGKRSQKRQCCLYCSQLNTKISRHMATHHASEIEVAKILSLPKKSKQRRKAWIELEAKGNSLYNEKVLEAGTGMIIPKYRPAANKNEKKYLPCEYCKAYIVKSDLWKHHKTCVVKPDGVKSDGPVRNSSLLVPVDCSHELNRDVISKMRDDVITTIVKSDPLIKEFGERRYGKTGKHQHTHQHISQRMRELGRFVQAMKKNDKEITNLSQCISPQKWRRVIQAARDVAGFNAEGHNFRSPSYALKIGHSLKKCARILRNQANEVGDIVVKERMNTFNELYEDEWEERVSGVALESLETAKYNSVKLLPLVKDVVLLSKHISKEISKAKSSQASDYTKLSKSVLAQVILFNRKRSGEAQRLKKDDFLKASMNPNVDEEIKRNLSKFEQELCMSHIRVETRGKRGRKVAILFTKAMKENVEFLLKLQDGLGYTSPYVFIPPNNINPYRGTKVLREAASEAGLKHPERITSTNLRKQLGTLCQVLGLTENEQDIIARFMGHDIRVHRQFYRLPQRTVEIAQVSKVLHCLNSGRLSEVKNKRLEDIDVNDDVVLDDLSDDDDDDDDEVDDDGKDAGRRRDSCQDSPPATRCMHVKRKQEQAELDSDDQLDSGDEWRPPSKKFRVCLSSESEDFAKPPTRKSKSSCSNRRPWTEEEKQIVLTEMKKNILLEKLPGKLQCEELIGKHEELRQRSWTMIKHFVRNKITAANKHLSADKA